MDLYDDIDATNTTRLQDNENGAITRVPCDIHGKHTFSVAGQLFCISTRYQLLAAVGFGAYGTVVSAIDKETKQRVAVKKVAGLFDDLVDAKRVLREIRLMRFLQHPNVRQCIREIDIDAQRFERNAWLG
jgi:serine/threonine protein kinase